MGRITGCVASASARITGFGTIKYLGHVLLAPFLAKNIILVSFNGSRCEVRKIGDTEEIVIQGMKCDGHYVCEIQV